MDQYLNVSRPASIPLRFGTDPYPVQARLVGLDGTERWIPATVVRLAPGHVMCRIPGSPKHPDALGYSRSDDYIWLRVEDVTTSAAQ